MVLWLGCDYFHQYSGMGRNLSVSHLDTNISKSGILAENLASYLCICTLPRPLMCFCKPMKTQINSCVFTVQTMIEFVVLYCDDKT